MKGPPFRTPGLNIACSCYTGKRYRFSGLNLSGIVFDQDYHSQREYTPEMSTLQDCVYVFGKGDQILIVNAGLTVYARI